MKQPESTKDLLANNDLLRNLVKKTQALQTLNQQLQSHLPDPLKQHCLVANLRDGCLVIETDSAIWATQLRYFSPDLLKKLQSVSEFSYLKSIDSYVRPRSPLQSNP